MSLPRWARWLLVGCTPIVVLLGAGIFAATRHFDREAITALVSTEVRNATGREIRFDGPIAFHFKPWLALRIEGVRLANAPWGSRPDMLKVERIEFDLALFPLLHGQLAIRRVLLAGVDLLLETDAAGQGNWVLQSPPKDASADSGGAALAVELAEAEIRDTTLSWRDGRGATTQTLGLARVLLQLDSDGHRLDAQLRYRDVPLKVKGRVGSLANLQAGAESYPLDLTLSMEGSTFGVKGDVGMGQKVGDLRLELRADIRQTAALSRLAASTIQLPVPLQLAASLQQTGTHIELPAFKLTLAGQSVNGKATLERGGPRAKLDLAVQADDLDFTALASPSTSSSAAETVLPKGGRLFSADPLPWPALPALDANVELSVAKVQVPGKQVLSALHAVFKLTDGRIDADPLAFQVGSGLASGSATLHLPARGVPALTLHARSSGVTLEQWLALAGKPNGISGGMTEMRLNLSSSGASAHQIVGGLNGEVMFKVERMRLAGNLHGLGGDLLTTLMEKVNPFYKQETASFVNCAAARLPVRGGAIEIDRTLALESDRLDVVAAGRIDLGAETIDLAILPSIKQGIGVGAASLAQLVKVSGNLASPSIGVNLKGAAMESLSIGAAVATGGLSLVGERLLKSGAEQQPCAAALGQRSTTPPAHLPDKKKSLDLPNPLKLFGKGR